MRSFGYFLVVSDFIWIHTWFGLSLWMETDSSLPFNYKDNIRDLLFHGLNLGGVVYLIRRNTTPPLSWLALLPSYIALLADIQHLVSVCVTLTSAHGGAWGCFLGLSIWAILTSIGGIFYFFNKKFFR